MGGQGKRLQPLAEKLLAQARSAAQVQPLADLPVQSTKKVLQPLAIRRIVIQTTSVQPLAELQHQRSRLQPFVEKHPV